AVLPEKYPLKKLISAHYNYNVLSIAELQKADVIFSENFFRIAKQLATGKVNPKKMYGDWEPYIPENDYATLLNKSLTDQKVYDALEDIKPKSELYKKY